MTERTAALNALADKVERDGPSVALDTMAGVLADSLYAIKYLCAPARMRDGKRLPRTDIEAALCGAIDDATIAVPDMKGKLDVSSVKRWFEP